MTNHDKNLAVALELAAANENYAEATIWLNGRDLDLTDGNDQDLVEMLVQFGPIRKKLEKLVDYLDYFGVCKSKPTPKAENAHREERQQKAAQ